MKIVRYIILSLFFFMSCHQANEKKETNTPQETKPISQLPEVDTSIYETFEIEEGDTTYLMKKYFMVHLKTGPNRDQDKEEAAEIQKAHLAHLSKLGEDKKICIAGPFESDSDILGIAVFSVPTLAIADSLANADPAVQAGRLTVDVFPFWAAVGSQLF